MKKRLSFLTLYLLTCYSIIAVTPFPFGEKKNNTKYSKTNKDPIPLTKKIVAPVTIYSNDFENCQDGYTEFGAYSDGSADYFIRTNGSDKDILCIPTFASSAIQFTNTNGYYYTGEDTDRPNENPNNTNPGLFGSQQYSSGVHFSAIDVSAHTNVKLKLDVAARANITFEPDLEYLKIYVDPVNNGNWDLIGAFEVQNLISSDSLAVDTNLDGLGDGIILKEAFQTFTFDVPSGATTMNVRIEMNSSSGNEEIAFDTFSLTGDLAGSTWTGTTNNDWNTNTNWDTNTVPISSTNVVINNVTNDPVISSTTGAAVNNITVNSGGDLVINGGGSIIVNGTSSGDLTYKVAIPDTNWHLISSPVVNEQYGDTWNTSNAINTNGSNEAVSTYINTSDSNGDWVYFQDGSSNTTFSSGKGYSMQRTANGNFSFTGAFSNTSLPVTITANNIGIAGENRWNLIGNSFAAYLDVNSFLTLTANATALTNAFEAVYIWDGANYTAITSGYLYPGQGFFVNSNLASTTINLNKDMLSHQTTATFYKNSTANPSIKLFISDGTSVKNTEINYLEDKTKGLDPRFDLGLFTGTANNFSIYSHLIENNEGIPFMKQALPNTNYGEMIVPIGINAKTNQEITFTTEVLNIPQDLDVILEDRETNIFTILDEENTKYTVLLTSDLNGIGRFYLHTNQYKTLSVNNLVKYEIQINQTSNKKLKISGLQNKIATLKIFSILGKEIKKISFEGSSTINIDLTNSLASGVYLLNLKTETSEINKKIIIQ